MSIRAKALLFLVLAVAVTALPWPEEGRTESVQPVRRASRLAGASSGAVANASSSTTRQTAYLPSMAAGLSDPVAPAATVRDPAVSAYLETKLDHPEPRMVAAAGLARVEGDRAVPQWPSATGRIYRIDMSSSPFSAFVTGVVSNISATPPVNTATITVQGATGFFPVGLE